MTHNSLRSLQESLDWDIFQLRNSIEKVKNSGKKGLISLAISDIREIATRYTLSCPEYEGDIQESAIKVLNTISKLDTYDITRNSLINPVYELISSLVSFLREIDF